MRNDSESCRNPSHVIEVNVQVWYRVNTEATNLGTCRDVIYRLANALAATTVACPPGHVAACLGWRALRLFK